MGDETQPTTKEIESDTTSTELLKPTPLDVLEGNPFRRWFLGFSYPFRGLRYLLTRPVLWPWAIAPLIITIALLVGAGILTWWLTPHVVGWLWAQPAGGWLYVLWQVVVTCVTLLVFVLCALTLYLLSSLVASPFFDQLSEKVEIIERGPREEVSWKQFFLELWTSILHSLLSLALWLILMLFGALLNLIPGIGSVIDFVFVTVCTAFLLSREMMEGPMSRRNYSFRQKLAFVWKHRAIAQGFGTGTAILLWIPLMNLLTMPIAVVGGTRLFLRIEDQERLNAEEASTTD